MTEEQEIRLECLKLVVTTASTPFSLSDILVATGRIADFVINGTPPEKVEPEPAPAVGRRAMWTKEHDDALRQMAAEGIPAHRIASRLGRTTAATQRRKSIIGITEASPGTLRSVAAMRAALAAKRATA